MNEEDIASLKENRASIEAGTVLSLAGLGKPLTYDRIWKARKAMEMIKDYKNELPLG